MWNVVSISSILTSLSILLLNTRACPVVSFHRRPAHKEKKKRYWIDSERHITPDRASLVSSSDA